MQRIEARLANEKLTYQLDPAFVEAHQPMSIDAVGENAARLVIDMDFPVITVRCKCTAT